MTLGDLLHPVGAPIEHVYFPESGMVSMLTVMKSGEQIETAIIGREGVIGGWVAIDGVNTNTQSTVQIEGSAQQVSTARFLETYRASDTFRSAMNAYQGVILFQANRALVVTLFIPSRRACAVGCCFRRTYWSQSTFL